MTDAYAIRYKILNDQSNFPVRDVQVPATREEIDFFAREGYLVRNNFLSLEQLEELRSAVHQLAAEEVAAGSRENYAGNALFIRHLFDKIPATLKFLEDETLVGISRAVLGPQIQFSEIVARVNFPGQEDCQLHWHIHNRVITDPLPPFFVYPHTIDALIYLDDVPLKGGPLCVIPGSHRDRHFYLEGNNTSDQEGQVIIPTQAGTCVFIHANLWHRALSIRQQENHRSLIMIEICPSWLKAGLPLGMQNGIKAKENHAQKFYENGSEEIKELLGKFSW